MQSSSLEYGSSPLRRLLSTSWRIGRAFDVEVRVAWTIVVWPLLFTLGFADWLTPGEAIGWGLAWTVALFACVFTHEMGHIAMGRRLGVESELMTLRGLGGIAHLDGPARNPGDELRISLAGPATHLAWMALLYPLVWLLEPSSAGQVGFLMLQAFAGLQFGLMAFNLLPVYPLDGGRVLRAGLALRMDASKATYLASTLGFVGNGLFLLLGACWLVSIGDSVGFERHGVLFAWIGLEGIRANRWLRREARYGGSYDDDDPFQKTLVAHRGAMRQPGRVRLGDEPRRVKRRAKHRRQRDALQRKIDRILVQIHEGGGIDAISARERRELEKASQAMADHDRPGP